MKFKQNLGIKITAVIFSYVMAFLLFLSVALVVVLGYYKFYFSTVDIVKEEVLTEITGNEPPLTFIVVVSILTGFVHSSIAYFSPRGNCALFKTDRTNGGGL